MDKIHVIGGKTLKGNIRISGAKNAALPVIAASILCSEEVEISNIPYLEDTRSMVELVEVLGAKAEFKNVIDQNSRRLIINSKSINNFTAPYDIVRKMRASILVLGPLLARFGEAKVSLPGGCAIGVRPIDMHIKALEQMGAKIELDGGYVIASAPNGLHGAVIEFDKVSVGATENTMSAAALAEGVTIIKNAAREPEIIDLANFLNVMGAKVSGAGESEIRIEGVKALKSAKHSLIGDRVEAGTYAAAAAITNGDLRLDGINPEFLAAVLDKLEEAGVNVERGDDYIRVFRAANQNLKGINFTTEPYPGFPTDLQAPIMTLMTIANGEDSNVSENIFENRFMHVPELTRMGAKISVEGNEAVVHGVSALKGAEVMATDLRASVSLILAAMVADGETVVNRVYHLYRGYENLVEKLRACGAEIWVEKAQDSATQKVSSASA